MAIIKEYLINTAENTVFAEIITDNKDLAKIYCDTGGDGGSAFRNALLAYTGPARPTMFFDGHQITDAGDKPTTHHVFNYAAKQWVDPRTPNTQWPIVRAERNQRLQSTDWTQLPDVPLSAKVAWAAYRQALRDVTNQADPFNIVWPTPPTQS